MAITTVGKNFKGAKKHTPKMKKGDEVFGDVSEMDYSERREYIEKKYLDKIKGASFSFMIHSTTGFSYDMKGDRKAIQKELLDYYKSESDYTESSLNENTMYMVKDWDMYRKEIDPDTDEVIDEYELTEVSADNTYNFSYLGAMDLNWRVYHDEEYDKWFYVIHPHLGGDPRGNYGDALILEGDDKEELFYRFYEGFISGSASIIILFNDGSSITFDSEQDSDVFNFRHQVYDDFETVSTAQVYLNDFNKFDSWHGDEFLEETVDLFMQEKKIDKKALGGGVGDDDEPRVYVQILGYPEGKWIELSDFSSGSDVIEHIQEMMDELNESKGGNREEYAFHDYEGYGEHLYDEYMGESEFDEIIESYDEFKNSDYPYEIVKEYIAYTNADSLSSALSDMQDKYYGSYDSISDFAEQMVSEGIYVPTPSEMYITKTDKRLIAGEEADARVDNMDAYDILELIGKGDEYDFEKSTLESEIDDLNDKISSLETYADNVEGYEYETAMNQITELEDEIEEKQELIDGLEEKYTKMYREDAVEVIYDEIYSRLDNDLEDWLDEYGYTSSDYNNLPFLNVDYEAIGKDLENQYVIIEDDGKFYVFMSYKDGGKVVRIGKAKKYPFYVVEITTKKIVGGWENKEDASDNKKELTKNNPKLRFGVYKHESLMPKFGIKDCTSYSNWIDLKDLDKASKVKIKKKVSTVKSKMENGGQMQQQEVTDADFQMQEQQPSKGRQVVQHFGDMAYEQGQEDLQSMKEYLEKDTIKGRIKRGARKVGEGASWLRQKWIDADFGDGKGKAKFFNDGGYLEDKELQKKAIEFIIGSAIDSSSMKDEGSEISFKYKHNSGKSSLSKKLIENTIRFNRKSLEGRNSFSEGGYVVFAENESGRYRKISEHDTHRGAKMKLDKVWNEQEEYDKIGFVTKEDWDKNYSQYTFKKGGSPYKQGVTTKMANGGGVKGKDENYNYIVGQIERNEKALEKTYGTERVERLQQEIQRLKDKLKNEYGVKYADGGWILMDGDTEKKIGEYETESEARKMMYEYDGNSVIVEKSKWNKYDDGGEIKIGDKININGIDYIYSERKKIDSKISPNHIEFYFSPLLSKEKPLIVDFTNDSEFHTWLKKMKSTYAKGGGADDFKMSYDEMTAYEKSNHIHYNPMNSRWEVTKNGVNKEFWNQEQAEKYAGFEFDDEKDSRYSRKRYEALFGYADGGGVDKQDWYDFDKKMALINLDQIHEYAVKLDKIITEKTKLEDWVKMKITRVEQSMVDVKKSLEGWEKFSEGGELVKQQLLHISKYSKDLIDMIQKGYKLMSWQENKLAVASEYIDNIYHYLDYQMGNRASDVKKMDVGGLSEVSDMLPSPLPMSTIQPMAHGGETDIVGNIKTNDLCISTLVDFVQSISEIKYVFFDSNTSNIIFVFKEVPTIDLLEDINLFLEAEEVDKSCSDIFTGHVSYKAENPYTLKVGLIKDAPYTFKEFEKGGAIPYRDKMFELPLEMVVYVPSTQDVNKVISVDEMDARVDEVKNYLATKFGGYTSSDKIGGFVDSNGILVNEEIVQVVAFSTKEAFEENRNQLIEQLAKWGKEWGQEAIGFEYEGDLLYVPQQLKRGGELWIQDAVEKMKSNGTEGAFTRQAKRHGKTPVEFAKQVLKNPENYRTTTLRRAVFVKNTNPEKF